jgi:hypothetical protein
MIACVLSRFQMRRDSTPFLDVAFSGIAMSCFFDVINQERPKSQQRQIVLKARTPATRRVPTSF